MRELDVLLTRFLDERFADMASAEQQRFAELLEADDPSLYAWLTGRELHQDLKMQDLIRQIKSF